MTDGRSALARRLAFRVFRRRGLRGRTVLRHRAAHVALVLVAALAVLLPVPAGGPVRAEAASAPVSPFPALQGPLHVTADEVVVDNSGTGLTARGHVRLTYAAGVATADALRLRRDDRIAELTGHATVTDPHGTASAMDVTVSFTPEHEISRITMTGAASAATRDYALQADRIQADRGTGRLAADGHVTAFSAPDLIINGDKAIFNERVHYALVLGHTVVSNRAGRILGQWIELFQQKKIAIVHGDATAEIYGATITGSAVRIDFARASAVFTGHVLITRRQGTLSADQVTILYNARRLIAEGNTHAHFTDLDAGSTAP